MHYNNSVLQISDVRKSDSETYLCSAVNLLGSVERKTQLVVVSLPVFTVKPPGKVFAGTGDTLTLNCSATGDPQPVISWKRQGAALPVRRSKRRNDALILRDLKEEDAGNYICVATSPGVFHIKAISDVEVLVMCSAGSRKWLISSSFADTKYRYSKIKWCRLTCAYFSHLWPFTRSSMSIYIRYKTRTLFAKFYSFCCLSNLGQIYQKN